MLPRGSVWIDKLYLDTFAARLEPPARSSPRADDLATNPVAGFEQAYAMRRDRITQCRQQHHHQEQVIGVFLCRADFDPPGTGSPFAGPVRRLFFSSVPCSS